MKSRPVQDSRKRAGPASSRWALKLDEAALKRVQFRTIGISPDASRLIFRYDGLRSHEDALLWIISGSAGFLPARYGSRGEALLQHAPDARGAATLKLVPLLGASGVFAGELFIHWREESRTSVETTFSIEQPYGCVRLRRTIFLKRNDVVRIPLP